MFNFICTTCGVQYSQSNQPPQCCPVCEDERQFVNWDGQEWTTLEALRTGHSNLIESVEPNLTSICTEPKFAIGQRALLVQTPSGNILWDCISLIDEATVMAVSARGGLAAIAISHPHFYSTMVEWSRAFDGVPIYLHADDRSWVMRPEEALVFWEGDSYKLSEGITLIRCGGHFQGSAVLHWQQGASGRGALLTGDTIHVVQDRKYVSFMYSYPNLIPMSASAVQEILKAIEGVSYERVHGIWRGASVFEEGSAAVARSARRYLAALSREWVPLATLPRNGWSLST